MKVQLIKVKGLRGSARRSGLVFNQKLHRNAIQLWKGAVREYLSAIMDAGKVPFLNDTGMSRASLIGMAREVQMVGKVRAWVTSGQKNSSRQGSYDEDGNYRPNIASTAALGEQMGEQSYKLLFGTIDRPVLQFKHEIPVWQYKLYESSSTPHNYSPYNSLDAGFEAFNAYMKANAGNLIPRLNEWLDTQQTRTVL